MSSRNKKSGASVAAVSEAQPTNDQGYILPVTMPEEKYVKKHPLNVNATFNKRLSLL